MPEPDALTRKAAFWRLVTPKLIRSVRRSASGLLGRPPRFPARTFLRTSVGSVGLVISVILSHTQSHIIARVDLFVTVVRRLVQCTGADRVLTRLCIAPASRSEAG